MICFNGFSEAVCPYKGEPDTSSSIPPFTELTKHRQPRTLTTPRTPPNQPGGRRGPIPSFGKARPREWDSGYPPSPALTSTVFVPQMVVARGGRGVLRAVRKG